MELKIFESFADASAFAKSLAQQGVAHNLRRNGSIWLVEHDQSNGVAQPPSVDIEPLLREIGAKDKETESLKKEINSLKDANSELRNKNNAFLAKMQENVKEINSLKDANFELREKNNAFLAKMQEKVIELTQDKKKALESERQILLEQMARVREEKNALSTQSHRLELLEKGYAKCFGEAEVKVVKERITSKEVCPTCGGDGGARGGCYKCDGIGWIDVTEEKSTEVVEIK